MNKYLPLILAVVLLYFLWRYSNGPTQVINRGVDFTQRGFQNQSELIAARSSGFAQVASIAKDTIASDTQKTIATTQANTTLQLAGYNRDLLSARDQLQYQLGMASIQAARDRGYDIIQQLKAAQRANAVNQGANAGANALKQLLDLLKARQQSMQMPRAQTPPINSSGRPILRRRNNLPYIGPILDGIAGIFQGPSIIGPGYNPPIAGYSYETGPDSWIDILPNSGSDNLQEWTDLQITDESGNEVWGFDSVDSPMDYGNIETGDYYA